MISLKTIIASFLLLLFTAAQTSVVHEFSHGDDDGKECSICLISQEFQSLSFDLAPPTDFQAVQTVIFKEKIDLGIAFAKADSQPTIYTTRPPPHLNYI